jgi:hypothetical protein
MATQTLTTFDALLKNVYRGPIVELLNQETFMIDQIEKENVNNMGAFTGRQLVFPVHTARNRGRGATTDGGSLAAPGYQSYLDGIVSIRYFDEGIELSDMVIKQSEKDEGAFVRALTSEMEGATTDLRKDLNRMVYGTGDGLLATVSGTPGAGTSITVDSGQYIAVGDTVDIIVKSSGATTNGVVGTAVTAVSYTGSASSATQTAATLTIGTATAGATSNLYGVYITGDRNNETDGLRNICNTGRTLHAINSTTYPVWDSNVISAAQSNPSEDQFMQLAQKIRLRSGKNIDVFVTSLGVQRRLANTYASQKRWNDTAVVKIDGGYSAIMVAAGNDPVPVVSDVDAPAGYAFALNRGSFAWAELAKPDWLEAPDGRGSILHIKDGATAGSKIALWQAWIVWYATLVCVAPLRNGALTTINDDVPVARL